MSIRIVVSGAPGTGKTTVATALAERLVLPLITHDGIKEALGDALGLGDEAWSDRLGDAAAEVLFSGWTEVFCHCDPDLAGRRMRERLARDRHPIHRDVINPAMLDGVAAFAAIVTPLHLGGPLVELDTSRRATADLDAVFDALGQTSER